MLYSKDVRMPAPGPLPGGEIEFRSNLFPAFLHNWQAPSIHNLSDPLSFLILPSYWQLQFAGICMDSRFLKVWFVKYSNECCSLLMFVEWQNEMRGVGSGCMSVPEINGTQHPPSWKMWIPPNLLYEEEEMVRKPKSPGGLG